MTPRIPERNDPCLCESGRKFKVCCGPSSSTLVDAEVERLGHDGIRLETAGDLPAAYARFRSAAALAPLNPRIRYMLGTAELNLGRYPDAIINLERTIRGEPIAEAHYNLGLALKHMGRLEDAALQFRHASLLKPAWSPATTTRPTPTRTPTGGRLGSTQTSRGCRRRRGGTRTSARLYCGAGRPYLCGRTRAP